MSDHPSAPNPENWLALQALLYAGDALPTGAAQEFELLLSQDQHAREALTLAAQVVHTTEPDSEILPNPAYRQRLHQQFAAAPTWWVWLCRRRTYPGHPAIWSGLGATAATVLLFALVRAFWIAPPPSAPPVAAPLPVQEAQAPPGTELDESACEEAQIWAELPRGEHLLKTHSQEVQRRTRSERLSQLEAGRRRAQSPSNKH